MIHGEKAHSRYFSEDAFKKLKGKDKEKPYQFILQKNFIPFDKIENFFKNNLK